MSKGHSGAGNKTFKFGNAEGVGRGKDNTHDLLPAYANVRIRSSSVDGAVKEFQKTHGHADHEWAYVINGQGGVNRYLEGNKSSVSINPASVPKGSLTIHNHPSGSHAPSKGDMLWLARSNSNAIAMVGKNKTTIVSKKPGFKSAQFERWVKRAKLNGKDYDDAVLKGLKGKQREFGFTVSTMKN